MKKDRFNAAAVDSDKEAGKLLPVANKHIQAASVSLKAVQ